MKLPSIAALSLVVYGALASEAQWNAVIDTLTQKGGDAIQTVAVGEFPCAQPGREGISTVSRLVADGLAGAITRRQSWTLVTSERLAELIERRKIEKGLSYDQETIEAAQWETADAILRGHYVVLDSQRQLHVSVELVRRKQATAIETTLKLPLNVLGTTEYFPYHVAESKRNVATVPKVPQRPQRIGVQLWTANGRRDFREGEAIRLRVRTNKDCYIAVLDHTATGKTIVLYPNRARRDTFVKTGEILRLPDKKDTFSMTAQAPYGQDVIQVLACTSAKELQKMIAGHKSPGGASVSILKRSKLQRRTRSFGGKNHAIGSARLSVTTYP